MDDPDTQTPRPISDPTTWVEQHGDYLFRYALQRLQNATVAEDVVQETFLAALRSNTRFAGDSSERTWFVAILRNKIVDHIRRVSREVQLDEEQIDGLALDPDFKASGPKAGMWKTGRRPTEWSVDPSDAVEIKEFQEHLQRCLSGLPDRARSAFVLREMEEMEPQEICNELKLSPTNLRVLLHRARKLLRRCLEMNWIGEKKS